MAYVVICPNSCCGCSEPTFVGVYLSRELAVEAAETAGDLGGAFILDTVYATPLVPKVEGWAEEIAEPIESRRPY